MFRTIVSCFIIHLYIATGYASINSIISIDPRARWKSQGIVVAGGNGLGNALHQLSMPSGIHVDENQTVYVVDRDNHRIVEWRLGSTSGQVVAGGNGMGSSLNQLYQPFDVIVDRKSESLIICDYGNKRVVRWPRRNGITGEIIISGIACRGLTMDETGSLYVVDSGNSDVKRYRLGESVGTIVAGGNGIGHNANQLFEPQFVIVDRNESVYVSEFGQQRVTKWMKGATERIIVAGGNGKGVDFTRMVYIEGIVVDQIENVYVADLGNGRIMRWPKGSTEGSLIVGRKSTEQGLNQLNTPFGLSFDRSGNLYVTDMRNHQVLKFDIEFDG